MRKAGGSGIESAAVAAAALNAALKVQPILVLESGHVFDFDGRKQ